MAKASKKSLIIPDEIVINKILLLRDKKVMIDKDIAELYGVPTKRLNEQVKRNNKRFPQDFMFQLTQEESSRKVAISWLPVLSHHRACRSAHGGLLEKFPLVFCFPVVIVSKPYIP
jgi:hypothetical protein